MDRRRFATSLLALSMEAASNAQRGVLFARFDLTPSPKQFAVRDFGAVGNGVVDDTAAFERALSAAAMTGGTVTVPTGVFPVSRVLNVRDGVTLQGVGKRSILRRDDAKDPVIACNNVSHARVLGMALSGAFSFGIWIGRSSSVLVRHCFISGGTVHSPLGYCAGIFASESSGVRLEANTLSENGEIASGVLSADIQVNGLGTVASSEIMIVANQCRSTATQFCIAAFDMHGSQISNNVCSGAKTGPKNNNGYGILIYQTAGSPGSCYENTVAGNRVSDTGGSAIYLQNSHQSFVRNNSVDNACGAQADLTLPVAGIALNQSQHVDIANNRITRVGHAGISIASNREGVGHVAITNNVIAHARGMGIHLRGLLTDIRVSHNTVTDTNGGIGGYTDAAQDEIVIDNNIVLATTGSTPGIILGNASRATITNNRVSDSGGYGLLLSLNDDESKVKGNTVVRSGRASPGKYQDTRVMRRQKTDTVEHPKG